MKTKLLIFGITGDLGRHRLLPALEQIISTGDYSELTIVGVSRNLINIADLFVKVKNPDTFDGVLSTFSMNVQEASEYQRLREFSSLDSGEQLLIYLAVPPSAVGQIIDNLGAAGLNGPNVKVLFEKPFGTDLDSAKKVIAQTSKHYTESQIFRIDHYLAKEMAQNIVTIRSRNALFARIWNKQSIESIEVLTAETVGIEGRAAFYEQTGALRDLVQGHLLQLLALTLMNMPDDFSWEDLPKMRLQALMDIKPVNPDKAIRAQYDGYKNEVKNPDSQVETFAALDIETDQKEWAGVPIRIVTGKALDKKTTEIRVRLKKTDEAQSNCLVLRIQPDEGIDIQLFIKSPGYSGELEPRHLSFNYPPDEKLPDAYEQVIVDAISSRKSLFTCSDEVLRSWEILAPLQEAWKSNDRPLKTYTIGSSVKSILA